MEGWIKLHRKILDWEWYNDVNVRLVFIHLLLKANHSDKKWMGVDIKRGQVVTGRIELAKQIGISERNVRTAITKLKSTSELTSKSTNKFTILTITNYDTYQQNDQQNAKPLTSNRPATDHKQEYKNIRNKEYKTYTSENLTLEQVAERINQAFDIYLGRKFKGIESFKSNLEYWLGTYEPKEIADAIQNSKYDSFFKDKLTPVMLFRRKNPRGENVDYISQLLVKRNNGPIRTN